MDFRLPMCNTLTASSGGSARLLQSYYTVAVIVILLCILVTNKSRLGTRPTGHFSLTLFVVIHIHCHDIIITFQHSSVIIFGGVVGDISARNITQKEQLM